MLIPCWLMLNFRLNLLRRIEKRGMVLLYAIIYADNILGEEPQPIETDYVYAMKIEENKIKHITKIWYLNI